MDSKPRNGSAERHAEAGELAAAFAALRQATSAAPGDAMLHAVLASPVPLPDAGSARLTTEVGPGVAPARSLAPVLPAWRKVASLAAAALLLGLGLLFYHRHAEDPSLRAEVSRVEGAVSVMAAAQPEVWFSGQPIKAGMRLKAGETLVCGGPDMGCVVLRSGCTITLSPGSRVRFECFMPDPKLTIVAGKVRYEPAVAQCKVRLGATELRCEGGCCLDAATGPSGVALEVTRGVVEQRRDVGDSCCWDPVSVQPAGAMSCTTRPGK